MAAAAAVWGLLVLWVVGPWVARLRGARLHLRLFGSDARAAVALLAAAVVVVGVSLASLLVEGRAFDSYGWVLLTVAAVLAFAIVLVGWFGSWALGRLCLRAPSGRGDPFLNRTVSRSMVPILAAAVIVLGVALGGVLAVGEGWAIRQTGAGLPMPDEIANSDFRLLQERFVEMDKSFRQGAGQSGAAPGR
jgi:hypothetical protein